MHFCLVLRDDSHYECFEGKTEVLIQTRHHCCCTLACVHLVGRFPVQVPLFSDWWKPSLKTRRCPDSRMRRASVFGTFGLPRVGVLEAFSLSPQPAVLVASDAVPRPSGAPAPTGTGQQRARRGNGQSGRRNGSGEQVLPASSARTGRTLAGRTVARTSARKARTRDGSRLGCTDHEQNLAPKGRTAFSAGRSRERVTVGRLRRPSFRSRLLRTTGLERPPSLGPAGEAGLGP